MKGKYNIKSGSNNNPKPNKIPASITGKIGLGDSYKKQSLKTSKIRKVLAISCGVKSCCGA